MTRSYRVRVVAVTHDDQKKNLDEHLMRSRGWRLDTLDVRKAHFSSRITWLFASLRQRIFTNYFIMRLFSEGKTYAYSRYVSELIHLASRESADLFIAHNLPALPAAAMAAKSHGAKLGFDAEDFHRGEFLETPENAQLIKLTSAIEEKYIPLCDYVTAASDGIGAAYVGVLGIQQPLTILNTFPLADRSGHTPKKELLLERKGPGLSLYWYSQIIGPDRGLEDVLSAMAVVGEGLRLHVRGEWAEGYQEIFMEKVKSLNLLDAVHHLQPVPPEQLVERASMHDVGLVLESPETLNRRICVTNKILVYLLAGTGIVSTYTSGHKAILDTVPAAGFLYNFNDYNSLATKLKVWRDKPDFISKSKQVAREFAKSRYCWDIEKFKYQFLKTILYE